jgi:HAD superfamily hydrolase (TIGR01509 family)
MPAPIHALVFDFDGLILDTETSVFEAWVAVFEEHGSTLTLDEWLAEVGTRNALDLAGMLRDRSGRTDLDFDAINERRRLARDAMLEAERVRPGIVEWLDAAAERGLTLAIASSSEPEWVGPHLVRLGLRDRFAHLACWEGTLRAKPEPDLYLAACRAIGVEPAHALAIEDSAHGVAAAKAAGMRVVAVPNGVTAGMDLSAADLIVASLAECSLAEALQQLSRPDGRRHRTEP